LLSMVARRVSAAVMTRLAAATALLLLPRAPSTTSGNADKASCLPQIRKRRFPLRRKTIRPLIQRRWQRAQAHQLQPAFDNPSHDPSSLKHCADPRNELGRRGFCSGDDLCRSWRRVESGEAEWARAWGSVFKPTIQPRNALGDRHVVQGPPVKDNSRCFINVDAHYALSSGCFTQHRKR
jgi:hypothetical protein